MTEPQDTTKTVVAVPAAISVHEFADRLQLPTTKVIGELMKNGVMASINESIDYETASIIGGELGYEITLEEVKDERPVREAHDNTGPKVARPPVVAVMGHVDHGKTSLLDAIRKTTVADGEAGGITQHIGAYQVEKNDRLITFLDTPGHEAFSAIRAHGVRVTDVVVVVVAADDGVKPQTKEAIRLAKEAEAGIVVAINKVDKADADVNRVKQELSEAGLVPDDWGGDTPCIEVSAKQTQGLQELLDMILLVADINTPVASQSGSASGLIIESHMETGRGAVVTVLVEEGTLKAHDWLVAGSSYGKVRSMENYRGERIKSALPSTPVVVSGFKSVPKFGDWFEVVADEKAARVFQTSRERQSSIKSLIKPKSVSAKDIERAVTRGQVKELTVLVKADAQGSLESITQAFAALENDEVRVKIVSSGIGDISENDINTAVATGAMVIGFHVSISAAVNHLAKRSGVTFQMYKVIYDLLDDVRGWLSSMLDPEVIETEIGELELLAIFKTTKDRVICGGKVLSGQVDAGSHIVVKRGKETVGEVDLIELQKQQDSAQTVFADEECGMQVTREITPEVGDHFVFVRRETKERTL